jgi:L-asparaginase
MVKKLVFLAMGGTVAGTAASAGDNVGYTAAQVGVQDLLASVPGLKAILGGFEAVSEQVCQIDSKDLVHADWRALLGRISHYLAMPDVAGVVVTHGTDTLEETAYFLSCTVPAELLRQKPLVLTCAMRPASSLTPDGPGNMADAAAVALCQEAHGVLVVCAGTIHSATHVQKVHPYRTDAFDSGEAGPVGLVEEGRVRLLCNWPNVIASMHNVNSAAKLTGDWPRVELLISHAGATGVVVRALLRQDADEAPLRGIVVAGTGNGTIHKSMETALVEAQAQGIRVVRVSRCAYGQVVGGSPTDRSGAFATAGLSGVKARIALMLEIATQS